VLTREASVMPQVRGLDARPGAAVLDTPTGQMTWAVHVSLAPTWFDPAETSGIITPFMVLYALHDVAAGGTYVYGSYKDIDGLFLEQATELDPKRREATLHRIQQLIHEKVMIAPIWLNAGLSGLGPSVEESGIGVIVGYAFSAPYEDVKL